ncbi:type I toxin-antitoxin system SymE family toxin [Citrobacter portucalensis]|uniref:hypothetical protein n=1 Tax=Citrobacter portucalensis TaxID=1639133 RepID=UPI0015E8EEE1|nr:hypothetical protein [Citrobacter portucalensis]MBA8418498.1 hypothetical protein [Citrobacter freundii]QMM96401.1 hypothetical protein HVW92_19290 [Citrobacter freundii]WFZ23408.1 type I toxin-antitoxin system SymE family toxin [Citrobacter portucalensis]
MPIKIRVMPDCIVITTQNTRELYGCAEGLSVAYVNRQKMKLWQEGFPGRLTIPAHKAGIVIATLFLDIPVNHLYSLSSVESQGVELLYQQ